MDPLSDYQLPSMPFSLPGSSPPGSTGNVVSPGPSPLSPPMGPAAPNSAPPMLPPMSSPLAGPLSPESLLPLMGGDPSSMQYTVETQADGTLLLRLKNPDGTTGPVVQHLPAPKLKTGKK